MKSKEEILYEYSIDLMRMDDHFNGQLLQAMQTYATQQTASLQSRIKSLEQMLSDCERKRLTGERI